ncbi:MAG: hypothetical protein AAFX79_06620 [Planctomycetota bacterium]
MTQTHTQSQQDSLGSIVEDFDRQRSEQSPPQGGSGGGFNKNIVLAPLVLGLLIAAAVIAARSFRGEQASLESWSRQRTLIDRDTGAVFVDFRIPDGATFPMRNPETGRDTLVPAEPCYWTPEGGATLDPTWVYVPFGTASVECPDCGRPVRGRNPQPPLELMLEAADRERG